jgi:sugar lactone lactonase YvrE
VTTSFADSQENGTRNAKVDAQRSRTDESRRPRRNPMREEGGYFMIRHGRTGRTLGFLAVCLLALGAREVSAQKVQTVAANPGNQDGLLATQATLNGPYDLAVAADGSILVIEAGAVFNGGGFFAFPQISRITSDGKIARFAGNGSLASAGDGGPARDAQFNLPWEIAAAPNGNVYVVERSGNRVRLIDPKGVISTVAGDGTAGTGGDGGPATAAQISAARGIAVGPDGSLYIADTGNNKVRRVAPDGNISTFAGTGNVAFDGDGGKATAASLASPRELAVDKDGNVYIVDYNNNRIRRVDKDGNISTFAGNGEKGSGGDGGDAKAAQLEAMSDISFDAQGNLLVTQALANKVRRITTDGKINLVAGNEKADFTPDGAKAVEASLNTPLSAVADAAGGVLISESPNNRIRRVTPDGTLTTVAGGPGANGLNASQVSVVLPRGGVRDAAGNIYIADVGHVRILKVDPAGVVTVIAGNGTHGYLGDGKKATETGLGSPTGAQFHVDGLALDGQNHLYIPDIYAVRVLKVDLGTGIITTAAGNGTAGFAGDGGKATEAQLSDGFWNIVGAPDGSLFIADGNNHRVRKVDPNGIISTYAGNGAENFSGDGGKAIDAGIPGPDGLTLGPDGSLYITDTTDFRVRKVAPDGTISTVAGTGEKGYSGDGGKAIEAQVSDTIENVAVGANGNIYLADGANNVIRVVTPDGIINTLVGSGNEGFNGDDKSLKEVNLTEPRDLYIDAAGNLIIAEVGYSGAPPGNRIRLVTLAP